jgi:hypothetical protein
MHRLVLCIREAIKGLTNLLTQTLNCIVSIEGDPSCIVLTTASKETLGLIEVERAGI